MTYPRLSVVQPNWEEAHRRDAQGINHLLSVTDSLQSQIDTINSLLPHLTASGYGAAQQGTSIPNFDLGIAYRALPIDTESVTPKGFSFDLPNNSFAFDAQGIWVLTISIVIQGFAEAQSGRTTAIRLTNLSTGGFTDDYVIGIGRNTSDLSSTLSFQFELLPADIGQSYQVQIGGYDSITGGDLVVADVSLQQVGPLGQYL